MNCKCKCTILYNNLLLEICKNLIKYLERTESKVKLKNSDKLCFGICKNTTNLQISLVKPKKKLEIKYL